VFSRYVIGWTVQHRENGQLAKVLIEQATEQQPIGRGVLTVHPDPQRPGARQARIFRALGLRPPGAPPLFPPVPGDWAIRAVQQQIESDALHRLLAEYLTALGAMTMIAVGTGWLLADRALRSLRDLTATARRVSEENLGKRIGLLGPADELKQLADTFYGMLERLERGVQLATALRRQRLA